MSLDQRSAPRLAIVQALYQMEVAGKGLNEIFAEFESHWIGREIEGVQYKPAEVTFFRDVLQGVLTDQVAIDRQIDRVLSGGWPLARLEAVMRAALRAGAWDDVLAAIEAMPESQAKEAAWRYWKARALAAAGRREEAAAGFATFAGETNFYAVLAAEALGRPLPETSPRDAAVAPPAATQAALAEFGARPAVRRTVKLASLDMKSESLREWIYAVRGLDDDALLVAAEYAHSQRLYDRDII